MSEDLEIELFNELPKFFFGNEKYLLLLGCVKVLDSFESCVLFINEVVVATSKPVVRYNNVQQKVCTNAFQFITVLPELKNGKQLNIQLKINFKNREQLFNLASIPIKKTTSKYEAEATEMVAVCMPLYQPNFKLFKLQLRSIYQQSYKKIKIFIQDDGSELAKLKEVEEYIKAFENVYLFKNKDNIGFYKNVELLLNKVGTSFKYVALSDQDDVWELDKIEKQVNFLRKQQADLCYTDLKIVNENKAVLQSSFWMGRSNHLQKPFVLNLRNVATGSTMLFRQNILKEVLPFPQQIGNVFHDHYICTQLQNTNNHKIVYLNETLTNYIQHTGNVTGFSKFKVQNFWNKLLSDMAFIKLFLQLIFKRNIQSYEELITDSEKFYFGNYQRLKLFSLHQNTLSLKQFFDTWSMVKIVVQTFFLSYKLYFGNIKLNRVDAIIYKKILMQFALRLRRAIQ